MDAKTDVAGNSLSKEAKNSANLLDKVSNLALYVEDVIRTLRVEGCKYEKPTLERFVDADLLEKNGISIEAFSGIVRDYLDMIRLGEKIGIVQPSERNLEFDDVGSFNNSSLNSSDSVLLNTSRFEDEGRLWQDEVYSYLRRYIDNTTETLRARIEEYAFHHSLSIVERLKAELGDNANLSKLGLRLNGVLAAAIARFRTELYNRVLRFKDDPELLYKLCFNSVMKLEGLDKLSDEDLLAKLEDDGISAEWFTRYTGRQINVNERKGALIIKSVEDAIRKAQIEALAINGEPSVDFRGQGVRYIQVPYGRYGRALKNLRDACAEDRNSRQPLLDGIPRPLTLKEIFIARLVQPNLWNKVLDSILGIAYSKDDRNKFKINPICRELAGLAEGYNMDYLPVDYSQFNGVELDRNDALYNLSLTREQFLAPHPAWFTVLEGDIDLMRAIADNVYTPQRTRALSFYLLDNINEDQLRHLFVYDFDYKSGVGSYDDHDDGCYFLRVTPN